MFLQLLRFEVFYQSKQRTLPIAGLIFFTFGCVLGSAGNAPAMVDFNAPFRISYLTGNLSLMSVFIIMFFAVSGAIRDSKYKMDGLIYSTSVQKAHFFWSRFLGVFLFSIIGFSLFLPGFWAGVSLSGLDPSGISPFRLQSYLWPFLVIIIPNVFICTALLFSVSLLSKSNVAVYASAVLMYILYFIIGIYSNSPMFASSLPASPEQMTKAAIADPFAISTFFEHTRFWTPFEKSNELLSFSGNYFWNRLLWIGFSLILLGGTFHLFSFRKIVNRGKKKLGSSNGGKTIRPYKAIQTQINKNTQWKAFWSTIQIDVKEVLQSLPFAAILITLLAALGFELYVRFYEGGFYNERWYPYTNLVIETAIEIVPILSKILIIFYSGALVWKARDQKFDGIINATPTLNWVFFLSKLATLFLLPMLLIATVIFVCLAFQLVNGFTNIDFAQYLLLFYYHGVPALVFSLVAIFIQSISKGKFIGIGITGLIILCLSTPLSHNLGIEHPMLRIGVMPIIPYSNMAGYGISVQSFHIYALYWTLLGVILAILSLKFWNRQLIEPRRLGKGIFQRKWNCSEVFVLSLSVISFTIIGTFLYQKLHLEGKYRSAEDKMDYSELYERKFKQYETLPRFDYVDMKTEVDLYPAEEKYTISADYQLINKNEIPVTQVFITETEKLTDVQLENAKLIFKDTVFGTYLFEFDAPILPQQTTRLRYQLTNHSLPFRPDYTIVKNGTYLRHEEFEPLLGYKRGLELSDPLERKKRGLTEQRKTPVYAFQQITAKKGIGDVSFETIVSTSKNQIALAPGNLMNHWSKNNRSYYQYKFPEKDVSLIVYLSAKYEVQKYSCNGVNTEFYYHPGHDANHQTIQATTCATLTYCMKNFGSYRLDHLRVAETPSYFPFEGAAPPGLINMVEDHLFLLDIRNNNAFNQVANLTAKKVADQWWGGILSTRSAPGSGFLVGGLAHYTTVPVLENKYGSSAIWEISKNFNEAYFRGRSLASTIEPPLFLEHGENYLIKGKSGLVLLAIRDLIGEDKLNTVLLNLLQQFSDSPAYEAQMNHFMDELYKVTPENYHPLINEWMKQIIRYDLKILNTKHKRLKDGKYEITATISAKRFKTLPSGKEVVIGIDEPIKIGCFDKHPKKMGIKDKAPYLKTHRITDNLTNLRIVVDVLPKYISVDPFLTRMDRNYSDNLTMIEK